jgi:hypothetical protein
MVVLSLLVIAVVGISGSLSVGWFAGVYAFFGVLLLMGVQWSTALAGDRRWLFSGGDPRAKLTGLRLMYAGFGIAVIASAFVGHLIRMWMQSR